MDGNRRFGSAVWTHHCLPGAQGSWRGGSTAAAVCSSCHWRQQQRCWAPGTCVQTDELTITICSAKAVSVAVNLSCAEMQLCWVCRQGWAVRALDWRQARAQAPCCSVLLAASWPRASTLEMAWAGDACTCLMPAMRYGSNSIDSTCCLSWHLLAGLLVSTSRVVGPVLMAC